MFPHAIADPRRRLFVDVLVSRRLRFRAFLVDPTVETFHTVGPTARRDGGARVLALLGPCRVNGVGGGVSSEDLQWLHVEDFDAFHDDFTSVALVAALGRLRDAVVAASHAAADAAWSPLGLSAPSARFACCSWWPDLPLLLRRHPRARPHRQGEASIRGMPSPVDRASPDQRWLDPARAENAFALLSSAAERVVVDGPYEVLTPAKAAAARRRAPRRRPENALANANTDVAWIVAGVDGSGGGSGGGVWPPEAVAAHGVLLAARRAGARAVVVVLTPRRVPTRRRRRGSQRPGRRRREPATRREPRTTPRPRRRSRRAASDPRRGIARGRGGDRPPRRSPPFVVPVDDFF